MLTLNEDGLLPCFKCRSEGYAGLNVGKGTWMTSRRLQYHCSDCRSAGPRYLEEDEAMAKEGWNRIQRALEAFDDAERSADLEERKLQAFENLMDHPEWGPGR